MFLLTSTERLTKLQLKEDPAGPPIPASEQETMSQRVFYLTLWGPLDGPTKWTSVGLL